jgi:alkanesulfonate monooxygenase SsuD/methylene tetrahydromethanopterin reductase-like flavin-dependent oxidoreductase (luciferase family)
MNIATNALTPAVREITDHYRTQWQAAGRDLAKLPLLGMSRHVVIAASDAEALVTARHGYARWYESFTYLWRRHGVPPISAAYPPTVEESMAIGMSFVGSPATVRAKLREALEITGVNYLMLRFAFGDMSLDEALRSVELFAREVRPALPST